MDRKIKIFFFLPKFGGGGAEKVIFNIVKNLDQEKFDTSLLVFEKIGYHAEMAKDISIIHLEAKNKGIKRRIRFFKLIKFIRQNPPDILFSSMIKVNIWIVISSFFFPKSVRVICRETNVLSVRGVNFIYNSLYKLFYNKAAGIVAQSNDMKADLINNFGVEPAKIRKINNPVDTENILQNINQNSDHILPQDKINLISAGSLSRKKGYHVFLKTFAELPNREAFHFTIMGAGGKKELLLKLAKKYGLTQQLTLLGHVKNPYPLFKQAEIFISSSKVEGFPNAVVEAMTCGLPVIANNYLGGINEIIIPGVNGKIIDISKATELEKAIDEVRHLPKTEISQSIVDRYRNPLILKQYSQFFIDLMKQ